VARIYYEIDYSVTDSVDDSTNGIFGDGGTSCLIGDRRVAAGAPGRMEVETQTLSDQELRLLQASLQTVRTYVVVQITTDIV